MRRKNYGVVMMMNDVDITISYIALILMVGILIGMLIHMKIGA